jgi:hypothetical protein
MAGVVTFITQYLEIVPGTYVPGPSQSEISEIGGVYSLIGIVTGFHKIGGRKFGKINLVQGVVDIYAQCKAGIVL